MLYICFRITRSEFLEIAGAIVQLFPTELECNYFVPSVRNTQAQGKLFTVYSKYRLNLREVGLINARKKIQGNFKRHSIFFL